MSVRQVADDSEVRRFASPGPVGENFVLAFSPDGRYLAVIYRLGSTHPLKVWRLDREEPVLVVDGPDASMARGSHPMVSGSRSSTTKARWFSTTWPRARAEASCDLGASVRDLAFSPDGRKLAVSPRGRSAQDQDLRCPVR